VTEPHPGAEDIIAFVDGEATAVIAEHVRACAACAAEARALGDLQQQLRGALYRFDCPEPQTIGEYQLGLLEPERRLEVGRHLVGCGPCAAELASLRAFLATDPARPIGLVGRLERTVATLLAAPPGWAAAGVRGVGQGRTRTYEAGDVAITLGGGPGTDGLCSLMGLVLRGGTISAITGAEVRLLAADGSARQAIIDDLGNFEFGALPTGLYGLELELPDQVVVVQEVSVGDA
jgi:hypothetical protein